MHSKSTARRRVQATLAALLLAASCAPNAQRAESTIDPAAIFTSAKETFESEQVTSISLSAMAATPSATLSETPPPAPTSAPLIQTPCDNSVYVSDVTAPDGALFASGSQFVKTWRVQNNGSCAWSAGYRLGFLGGDAMSGADLAIPSAVLPGAQTDLSVNLTAPTAAGEHSGQWQMINASGQPFGNVFTVVIQVGGAAECKRSSKTQVTISGHAGPENVTMDYGDGVVVTDSHGDYAFNVAAGWSGTVTPSKAKVHPWTFEPDHRTYTSVNCDLKNENYKATAPPGV